MVRTRNGGGSAGPCARAPAFQGHKLGNNENLEQMKKLIYLVKLGFSRITPKGLLSSGRTIVLKMTGNALYASIAAKITALGTALDNLELADDAYDFNHGKMEREALLGSVVEVKDGIRELGGYVQAISQGDKDIILAAGFDVRKAPSPVGELPAPALVQAFTTAYPGRIDLRWSGVKGRGAYEVYVAKGDPGVEANWSLSAVTTRNRHSVEGLSSLTEYHFRIVAQGPAGASPASMVATALAA